MRASVVNVLLVTPPSTQLNTPYPATAYLRRFLDGHGVPARQADLGIELAHRLFSSSGLREVFEVVESAADEGLPEPAWMALSLADRHLAVVDRVMSFLAGQDPGAATALARPGTLPPGPRLDRAQDVADRFGPMGITDLARYRATLYLEDLADLVTAVVDPGFGFSRYQHHLAVGPIRFAPIAERLAETSLPDSLLDALVDELCAAGVPDLVGITVPFPGTLYGALRVGERFKRRGAQVVLGGGYVSTELRQVEEPGLWACTDALVYDDGEGPLRAIVDHMAGLGDRRHRTRTAAGLLEAASPRVAFTPAASYDGLDLSAYLQVLDTVNPAHRLWSDGRWNKITLAHGCYWKRCAFCDVELDYIARFEPARTDALVDHVEELVAQTGTSGFHFVDEAAPPRLMRNFALNLLARGVSIDWWGNIRFESAFTPDLCALLSAAGLVAVTGGLEVASDRLLGLMDKGITVEQAARAAQAFQLAGVRVHAYLMYGFPTQTDAETIDSMEVVRQLFAAGLLDSGFWHRFVLTRHSRVFTHPERFGVSFSVPKGPLFATNDLPHVDPSGGDHDRFDGPLAQALQSWMAGRELERPVMDWFAGEVPSPVSPRDRVLGCLGDVPEPKEGARLVWVGQGILDAGDHLRLVGRQGEMHAVYGSRDAMDWLTEVIDAASPGTDVLRWRDAMAAFPGRIRRFERGLAIARQAGLLAV